MEDYKKYSARQLVEIYSNYNRLTMHLITTYSPTDNVAWREIHKLDHEKDLIVEELERRMA